MIIEEGKAQLLIKVKGMKGLLHQIGILGNNTNSIIHKQNNI